MSSASHDQDKDAIAGVGRGGAGMPYEVESIDLPRGPGCLIQLLWFLLVGWWVIHLWAAVAWVLLVSIVGIPLGLWMLHRVPLVVALRDPREVRVRMIRSGQGGWIYRETGAEQYPFLVRAIYFVLVGWWLSAAWMALASLVVSTIIGLPLGIWMFDLVPSLVSLQR